MSAEVMIYGNQSAKYTNKAAAQASTMGIHADREGHLRAARCVIQRINIDKPRQICFRLDISK
ncbi:unnamed protein product [Ceratitis capitata]|uniref:(Mediterranean fruit fly) hypothetical protein n=1 Tax=Ceratitis capitata TaxID=7213 RepID=A0A811V6T2_CERCA|nr:unnamed protein product [Ceratitis capitata]